MSPAQLVMRRCDELGAITGEPGRITRTFASPAMRRANELVAKWMRGAGMTTRVDAIGNLIGHYAATGENGRWRMEDGRHLTPVLLLGSHLDTVRNAGKYDGPLGVILAIACVEELRRKKVRLPFAVEVIGFGDEEGVRYQTAYLGSKVLAGCFDEKDLKRKDAEGISMADAIREFGGDPAQLKQARLDPKTLLGYLEAHIEQGPVLEKNNRAVGVVTAIAGQSRLKFIFMGRAGHAGTTPMTLRRDALCAASEFILAVEKHARKTAGLVATAGQIHAEPGASNVIPGVVTLTLDARHQKDFVRRAAKAMLRKAARQIAARRGLKVAAQVVQQTNSVPCSRELSQLLKRSARKHQNKILELPSGAGHDAAVMAKIAPAAMLFIRCKGGISHHPNEAVRVRDVTVALNVMREFVLQLAKSA